MTLLEMVTVLVLALLIPTVMPDAPLVVVVMDPVEAESPMMLPAVVPTFNNPATRYMPLQAPPALADVDAVVKLCPAMMFPRIFDAVVVPTLMFMAEKFNATAAVRVYCPVPLEVAYPMMLFAMVKLFPEFDR